MVEKVNFGHIEYIFTWNAPVKIIEHAELDDELFYDIEFDLQDSSSTAFLAQLLYELRNEVSCYRKYFRDNNINHLGIIYGGNNEA